MCARTFECTMKLNGNSLQLTHEKVLPCAFLVYLHFWDNLSHSQVNVFCLPC